MKLLFLGIVIILSSALAKASCGHSKKALFFANGIFNDRGAANFSLLTLKKAFKQRHPDTKIQNFDLAYNTDEQVLLQLFQVHRQKMSVSKISFWRALPSLLITQDPTFISKILNEEKFKDHDLRIQIKRYKFLIDEGFNIVTVAHSQGNFYTLFSFEDLASKSSQMVSVATPANFVYNEGPYFTFTSDRVVKYIPGALTPNIKKTSEGVFDHEFVNDYMEDGPTKESILSAVNSSFQDLNNGENPSLDPVAGYFNSDMTKTLEWFRGYLKSKRKLSAEECIFVESLFSVYALHGRECEGRNFSTFSENIRDCSKKLNSEGGEGTSCPYYRGMDFANPYKAFYPPEAAEHYALNPQCEMTFDQFSSLPRQTFEEAVKMLN